MSDILNGAVPVSRFYLFSDQGSSTGPFNLNKPIKRWAAPADFDFAAHGVQDMGDFLIFPLSVVSDGVHNPSVSHPFVVLKEDVFKTNIPPAVTMPGVPSVPAGLKTVPMPLDKAQWDDTNYYLTTEGPLHLDIMVRDHRNDDALPATYTVGDQRRLARIEAAVNQFVAK